MAAAGAVGGLHLAAPIRRHRRAGVRLVSRGPESSELHQRLEPGRSAPLLHEHADRRQSGTGADAAPVVVLRIRTGALPVSIQSLAVDAVHSG